MNTISMRASGILNVTVAYLDACWPSRFVPAEDHQCCSRSLVIFQSLFFDSDSAWDDRLWTAARAAAPEKRKSCITELAFAVTDVRRDLDASMFLITSWLLCIELKKHRTTLGSFFAKVSRRSM